MLELLCFKKKERGVIHGTSRHHTVQQSAVPVLEPFREWHCS